ncbi:MAG: hypothetical protein ACTTGU_07640 [Moraxella sp.]
MNFKDAIFKMAKQPLPPTPYTCPITHTQAYVKNFTVAEREQYSLAVSGAKDGLANATAFVNIVCDEQGHLIFEQKDVETVAKLPEDVVLAAIREFNNKPDLTLKDVQKNS